MKLIIGRAWQMASACIGAHSMPPLFGLIASKASISFLPWYLLIILAVMVLTHRRMLRRVA